MSKKIPDRWLDYKPIGRCIEGTRLITFKVPLKKGLCDSIPAGARFTPQDLMQMMSNSGYQLGLIIDLTNTNRYYDKEEFSRVGVEYRKIFTEGRVIPSNRVVHSFKSAVEGFLRCHSDDGLLIGVHCTHGVNRTGYLVCRYMIESTDMAATDALAAYAKARGHRVERENYIADLHRISDARHALGESRASPTERPSELPQRWDVLGRESHASGSAQASCLVVPDHYSSSSNCEKFEEKLSRRQWRRRKQRGVAMHDEPPHSQRDSGGTHSSHVPQDNRARPSERWRSARPPGGGPRGGHGHGHRDQPVRRDQAPGPRSAPGSRSRGGGHREVDLAQFGRGPADRSAWASFHGYRHPRPEYHD